MLFRSVAAGCALASLAAAHSWLECVDYDREAGFSELKAGKEKDPNAWPSGVYNDFNDHCKGYPRGFSLSDNFVSRGTPHTGTSIWQVEDQWYASKGLCHTKQKSRSYGSDTPMARTTPGGTLTLRYPGNGHSEGNVCQGDPGCGTVAVYWTGSPDQDMTELSELDEAKCLGKKKFADLDEGDLFWKDGSGKLCDKGGNFLQITIPEDTPSGTYFAVWVWEWKGKPRFTTCFDIEVSGGSSPPSPSGKDKSPKDQSGNYPQNGPDEERGQKEIQQNQPMYTPGQVSEKAAAPAQPAKEQTPDYLCERRRRQLERRRLNLKLSAKKSRDRKLRARSRVHY